MPEKIQRPHVVIIGGGFGGLRAAQDLARAPVDVTLVDSHNHHLFQPLLYQVATAGMMAESIAVPIRSVLRKQKNATVVMATASGVDLDARQVQLEGSEPLSYDYLIVAAGARTHYFGNDGWAAHTLGLKSVADAYAIRKRVLLAFEAAELTCSAERRRELLTFVVIGGGPTGVEMAGALAELSRTALAKDFRNVTPQDIRVVLLEAAPTLLLAFHTNLRENAKQSLARLGVEVQTGTKVTDITADGVGLADSFIKAQLIVWAAGVSPQPLAARIKGVTPTQRGYLSVEKDCSLPGYPEAFAIGDIAAFVPTDTKLSPGQTARPLPGVAPVAIQQASHVATSIRRDIKAQSRTAFSYFDKGNMATIGKSRAVLEVGRLRLHGFIAWLAWLAVHVFLLIGFRNRVVVMFEWAWSYLTNHRGARLIDQGAGSRNQADSVTQRELAQAGAQGERLPNRAGWAQNVGAQPVPAEPEAQ